MFLSLRIALLAGPMIFTGLAHADDLAGHPRIVDGDTVSFGAARVRLDGIDAPETHQLCQDGTGQAYRCGLTAAAALAGEIAGQPIDCRGTDRDRYGRLIATCWKGSEDLNAWMVAHGWALAYRRYSTAYVELEDVARAAGVGVWAGSLEAPWDWRRDH